MTAYISRKASWLRYLVSFLPGAGAAALFCVLFSGPRLGPLYDFLLTWRSPPVAREILLIDSSAPGGELDSDILDPGAAVSLLYTMAEFGARTLIIQVPVLGLPAGGSADEAEILYRFDEEFSLLSGNIRNLFDAIRTGSVAPAEAARYVGMLVELSETGKERLVSALIRRDAESIDRMEKAAAFFGAVRRPGDLRVQLIASGGRGRPGVLAETSEYSRPQNDRDGVLRRAALALNVPYISEEGAAERTLEHIIYGALKERFEPEGIAAFLPLDRSGAVLFEIPHRETFRRISILDVMAYEEAERELRRLIAEGESQGIFRGINGENRPGFLFDHALFLRGGGSGGSSIEVNKLAWLSFRTRYFESLESFLSGTAAGTVAAGAPDVVSALRAKHSEVLLLRHKLQEALEDSFSILGNPEYTKASALLANSILTRRAIEPGEFLYLLLGSLVSALLICFFIKSLPPAKTLGIGVLLTLLCTTGFSVFFVVSGIWLDPQAPAIASAIGVLISFAFALAAKTRHSRRFNLAYAPIVSRPCLESLIEAGKPQPSKIIATQAAVVAIKNERSVPSEHTDDRLAPSHETLAFQEKAAELVKKAEATIIGTEGDIVIACFASPLERVFLESREQSPYEGIIRAPSAMALHAVDFVSDVARQAGCESWHFGIHMGNCTFIWTELSGYFALGIPVQRAKILSRLTGRYKSRIIVSSSIHEFLPDMVGKKLGILKENDGSESELFYRLADKG